MKRGDLKVVTIVLVFLGFFTALAIESGGSSLKMDSIGSVQTLEELLESRKVAQETREELLDELKSREEHIYRLEREISKFEASEKDIESQLSELRMLSGLMDLEGPGIEIILNDRKKDEIIYSNPGLVDQFIVHDSDLLNIVNELKAAGAEAISINDTRIIESSRISCGGPTINIGKEHRFAPPFKIEAIGDPQVLADCFKKEDSIYHILDAWGLEFTIKKSDHIYIPRYIYGALDYKYAKIIKEDG